MSNFQEREVRERAAVYLDKAFPSHVDLVLVLKEVLDRAALPAQINLDDHYIVGQTCACGWEPALGKSTWRSFDLHLADILSKQ